MTESLTDRLLFELTELVRDRYYGKYRGLVRDVDDPEHLGRIRALVQEVYGADVLSPWAMPASPFAGPQHGLVLLPENGDGVWIEFEAGRIDRPIWSGFFWARDQVPAPGAAKVRVLATTGGHKLVLDDDKNKIRLIHAKGAELTMTETEVTLQFSDKRKIVLSSTGVSINGGALEVK